MFCTRCGSQVAEGSAFCARCGAPTAAGSGTTLVGGSPTAASPMTRVSDLVMLRDKLVASSGFQVQDPSGRALGEIRGGAPELLSGLTLLDSEHQIVLRLQALREHGLQFGVTISDATGATLATLHPKTSFGAQKWGISIGGSEAMILVVEMSALHYRIEDAKTGAVVASADREMALRLSRTRVRFAEAPGVDRRIVLGSMTAAAFFTIRGTG